MRLNSVRSLKQELQEEPVVPRVLTRALGVATLSARTAALFREAHVRMAQTATVALGVARGRSGKDFRLGARVQVGGRRGHALASHIEERSRGECDVRIVPRIVKRAARTPSWFRKRHRPLEAGLSVGHYEITAGTLGFIVKDDDAHYVLSNNHVLADVNTGHPGDPVLQPGPADHESSAKTMIAVLDRFVPLSFRRSNVVDCGVAELFEQVAFYPGWTEALPGLVTGVEPVSTGDLGRAVRKAGRTTGVTEGIITQVEVDGLRVDMGEEGTPQMAIFSDQLEVQGSKGHRFSDGGDSGSLIVDKRGKARGLLFAGGEGEREMDLTFANRIEVVLKKLGVSLVT